MIDSSKPRGRGRRLKKRTTYNAIKKRESILTVPEGDSVPYEELTDEEFFALCKESSNLIFKINKNFDYLDEAYKRVAKKLYTRTNSLSRSTKIMRAFWLLSFCFAM